MQVFYRILSSTLLCAALFAILWGLQSLSRPIIGSPRYAIDGGPWIEGKLPLSFPSSGKDIQIELPISLSSLTPRTFHIRPDDCLDAIAVNGFPVLSDAFPFCDYANGKPIDLHAYLKTGQNALTFSLRDDGGMGGIDVRPIASHPLPLLITLGWLSVALWYTWKLSNLLPLTNTLRPLLWVAALGALLRVLYVLHTPYTLRGHDADGHLEYVRYLAQHWWLPDSMAGWEFYHPPLYYGLSALWLLLGNALGFPPEGEPQSLQLFSLLISIASLPLIAWVAILLFPKPKERLLSLLFFSVISLLPSIVFLAARINNDILAFPLSLAAFGFLLRWWHHRLARDWYWLSMSIGLALLTKGTAFLLLIPLTITLLLIPRFSLRRRFELWSVSMILCLLLAGWFHASRFFFEHRADAFLVGNIRNLNSGLRTEQSVAGFLTFSPVGILRHPFNNSWNDAERRGNLWEYFFRSAFFGEFSFPTALRPLSILLLLTALFLLPLTLLGMLFEIRKKHLGSIPSLSTLFALLLGTAGMYFLSPYASLYDFRYALLIALPVIFFLLRGASLLPPILRSMAYGGVLLLGTLCGIFIVAISIV